MNKFTLPSLNKFIKEARARFASPGGFAIPVTIPVAIIMAMIFFCAIGWAFFMGYMVGKGQNPEESLQEIAGIAKTGEQEKIPDAPEAEEPPVMAKTGQIPEESPAPEPPAQFTRPEGNENNAWESSPPRLSPPAQKPQKPKPARQQELKYVFTYQAAAFRTRDEAEKLKSRLEKAGIRCQTRKDGRVFLVLATLRGTDTEALGMKKKLAGMKLGNPLLLSKKPVGNQKGSRK